MHSGAEMPLAVRFFMAFLIVLVVAVAVVLFVRWGLRRLFGTNRVLDKYIAILPIESNRLGDDYIWHNWFGCRPKQILFKWC